MSPLDGEMRRRGPPVASCVVPLPPHLDRVLCPPQAWLNEKFSPELLESRSEVVECVMEQLTHMVILPHCKHAVPGKGPALKRLLKYSRQKCT